MAICSQIVHHKKDTWSDVGGEIIYFMSPHLTQINKNSNIDIMLEELYNSGETPCLLIMQTDS